LSEAQTTGEYEHIGNQLRAHLGASGQPKDALIGHSAIEDIVDKTKYRRLQVVLAGLQPGSNNSLVAVRDSRTGVSLVNLTQWYGARYFGGASTPYECMEANLYGLESYTAHITQAEKKAGLFPGHTATYGEVNIAGIASVVQKLGGLNVTDNFYDLGSGFGKAVQQMFLTTGATRCVGVELSVARHNIASEALQRLQHRYPALWEDVHRGDRSIEFRHESILDTEMHDATVIWMGSLAFPSELMGKIARSILQQVRPGCVIITFIDFPVLSVAGVQKRLSLRATWMVQVRWKTDGPGLKTMVYDVVAG